jgi:glutaredoxin
MVKVVLYTRGGCHLCDDAHALLLRHRLQPEIVDIDGDPQLRERFTNCVPVVEINGKVRFRGRINEVLLNRLLEKERDFGS